MTDAVFFRLLDADDKAAALADAVSALRAGRPSPGVTYLADPQSFRQVPGSPFAYWVSEAMRHKFESVLSLEERGYVAAIGASTKNDIRYLRAWWESRPQLAARSRPATLEGRRWVPFAKGGSFSPFYSDLDLTIDWMDDGQVLKEDISDYRMRHGWGSQWSAELHGHSRYFRPGLTWSRRTQGGLSFRTLPAGCIFADKGPVVFAEPSDLAPLLAVVNSAPFIQLVSLQMAFGSYEVGVIQRTPVPPLDESLRSRLGELALCCFEIKRALDTANETSHAFVLPALLQVAGETLAERHAAWHARVADAEAALASNQREIDDRAYALYGIADDDRRALEATGRQAAAGGGGAEDDDDTAEADAVGGGDGRALADALLSYALGCAFGRWDLRIAADASLAPKLGGPFDPLPVCSPGMLVGPDGLPAARPLPSSGQATAHVSDQEAVAADTYPLPIAWDGILVDDPDHAQDLVRQVRAALAAAWGGADGPLSPAAVDALERDLCAALGTAGLRDYFRNPRGFFDAHLKRYSKSRRKAPIYWPLQSKARRYTIWLYYHRLDADLLAKARMRYVEPKLALEDARLRELEARRASVERGPARRAVDRAIDRQQELLTDLRDFRDRLARAAGLGLTPDLDDGVLLNAAPLHELLPAGFKAAGEACRELLAGKYAWSSIGQQLQARGMAPPDEQRRVSPTEAHRGA